MSLGDGQQRRQRRAWLFASVLGVAIFGPGIAQWAWLAWRSEQLARNQQRLKAANQQLTHEHEQLISDPVYVEGLIRSTFKFAKPGELVVPLEAPSDKRSRSAL